MPGWEQVAFVARRSCCISGEGFRSKAFPLLSPVAATPSHPEAEPLGWERFGAWVRDLPLPVYALGGLGPGDLEAAHAARAQGVAGIRGFWPGRSLDGSATDEHR